MVHLANLRQKKILTFALLVADVDPERNAIPTPSQGTPEHFVSFTDIPDKIKKGSLNNQTVLWKTAHCIVKQLSKMDDEQSVIRSPELKKERKPLQRSPVKVCSVLSAEGIKWKTCGLYIMHNI